MPDRRVQRTTALVRPAAFGAAVRRSGLSHRMLASRAHCSPGLVGFLVRGGRLGCNEKIAMALTEALAKPLRRDVEELFGELFAPSLSGHTARERM